MLAKAQPTIEKLSGKASLSLGGVNAGQAGEGIWQEDSANEQQLPVYSIPTLILPPNTAAHRNGTLYGALGK